MLQPRLAPAKDGQGVWGYQLVEDYPAQVAGHEILVPKGFDYDGATIPSLAWQAIYTPFHPIVMGPALVHDWLYSSHQTTRDQADLALRDLLLENGVPETKARVIYDAVRAFGGAYWNNTHADLAYLKGLFEPLAGSPQLAKYHFPLEAMGIQ